MPGLQQESRREIPSPPVLTPGEYASFSKLAHEHFGLDLSAGKQGLVAARLSRKLNQLGMNSFQEYYDRIVGDRTGKELEELVDLLTTNHTGFFRESRHFDLLRQTILPQLLGRNTVNIWSAACASGEEPYTIAVAVREELGPRIAPQVRITATDISTRVLTRARQAIYSQDRLKGFPEPLMSRYLLRSTSEGEFSYRFKDEIRQMVSFHHRNLIHEFSDLPKFSVIFCRNIMIYFDKATQQTLVDRLRQQLEPGGYLLIGHSENLNSIDHSLKYICPATYRNPAEPSRNGGAA
jgi:chemotaxis protein methyltransferase CheR